MTEMKTLTIGEATYEIVDAEAREQIAEMREEGAAAVIDDTIVGGKAWSSKNTVDKLCPSFTASGPVVTCEPLSGYPLAVQTNGATKVYRGSKNLVKIKPGTTTKNGVTFTCNEGGTAVVNGTATADATITISEKLPIKAGTTYTLSGCTGGGYKTYQLYIEVSGVINLYNSSIPYTRVASGSGLVEAKFCVYAGTTVSNLVIKPQLEIGSTATAFEPGRETEEFTPGEVIPALDGVNTLCADSGDITVTGVADPLAVSRKQDERIAALEASLTALLEG